MIMIAEAINLAKQAHLGQYRNGNCEPYINHPARVAMAVSLNTHRDILNDEMIAAAWLHDVIEDTHYTYKHIVNICGPEVANLVIQLTFKTNGLEHLSYRDQKLVQNTHIAAASYSAKIIKVYDRIDNLRDFYARYDGFVFRSFNEEANRAKNRLDRYLDVSWELVKLLSTQTKDLMDEDAFANLNVAVRAIAKNAEFELK